MQVTSGLEALTRLPSVCSKSAGTSTVAGHMQQTFLIYLCKPLNLTNMIVSSHGLSKTIHAPDADLNLTNNVLQVDEP